MDGNEALAFCMRANGSEARTLHSVYQFVPLLPQKPEERVLIDVADIPDFYRRFVPVYKSTAGIKQPFLVRIKSWDSKYPHAIAKISAKRAGNRVDSYIINEEMVRVRKRLEAKPGGDCSIRFGVAKTGKGLRGERGDLCLIEVLGRLLRVEWKTVKIIALHARVFAVKGNSNQRFYPKLMEVLGL